MVRKAHYNRPVERLDRTAVDVLRVALDRQPLTPAKVGFAWAIAAGPALARAATAVWSDGTLSVAAKSDAWQHEIERARPVILQRLRQLLGPNIVRHMPVRRAEFDPEGRR